MSPEGDLNLASAEIDRGFLRIPAGLLHYRSAATWAGSASFPLYMAQAGPGCARGLEPFFADLAKARKVIAPDMLGTAVSGPPAVSVTDIHYYVECVVQTLDKLGIDKVDFYGQHSGAHIGCEFALQHPDRIGKLILDGVALFPPELKAEMIRHYAPAVTPDDFGGHLLWAWNFVREMPVHFPYFMRDPAHRLHDSAVPSPAAAHELVVDILKALPTYHLAYQAIFAHATAERLVQLRLSTLVMAVDGDPLASFVAQAADLVHQSTRKQVPRDRRTATIESVLND